MANYELYQVYYVPGGFTAVKADQPAPPQALWSVEKPVKASSARAAVRKVNTRTKAAQHPQPFIHPDKVKTLPPRNTGHVTSLEKWKLP